MKELEDLNLTFCCMLTDVSLKLLGTSNSKLRRLDLSFCGAAVSDYSLSNLKGLTNLEYLSIKGCVRVTREGVDMLLTEIQNLKELNLLQCPRVNVFRGVAVEPFNKIDKCNYSCLKIKPHGRIVKVFV
jgi:F-box and leucine-rich repeat protein 7